MLSLVIGLIVMPIHSVTAHVYVLELAQDQVVYLEIPHLFFRIPKRFRIVPKPLILSEKEQPWQVAFEDSDSKVYIRVGWQGPGIKITHKNLKLLSMLDTENLNDNSTNTSSNLSYSRMFYPRELEMMGAYSGLTGMQYLGEKITGGWRLQAFSYFHKNEFLITISILQKENPVLKADISNLVADLAREKTEGHPNFIIPKTARFFEGKIEDWKRYHKAVELWRLDKKNQKAIGLLEENPEHYESLVTMGTILGEDGIFDKAETTLEKAIALKPGKPIGYIQLLQVYLLQKKLPSVREKIAAFRKANKELNHEIDYYAGYLAYAENKRGELKSAIQNIERYIKQDGINQLGPAPKQLELLKKYLTELKG